MHRVSLTTVTIVFILGYGIGWLSSLLVNSREVRTGHSPSPSNNTPAPTAPVNPSHDKPAAPPPVVDFKLAAIQDELARLRAESRSAEIPIAAGSILGRTLEEFSDSPLSGITIVLEAFPRETRSHRSDPDQELLQKAHELIYRELWSEARRQQTITDDDGSFRFDNLAADARYVVVPNDDTHDFNPTLADVAVGGSVEFFGSWAVPLDVDVRFANGDVPADAQIEANQGPTRSMTGWSPDSGTPLRLRPGNYLLSASHGMFRSPDVELRVVYGRKLDPVTLELESRTGFRGEVVLPALLLGDASHNLHGRFMKQRPGKSMDVADLATSRKFDVAHDRSFVVLDLPPGRYRVGVGRGDDSVIDVSEEIEIEAGVTEVTLTYPGVAEQLTLRAQVFEGESVASGKARFLFVWDQGSRAGLHRAEMPAIREPGGHYTLIVDRQMQSVLDDPDVEAAVAVEVAGLGTQQSTFSRGRPQLLSFEFAPAASCSVTLVPASNGRTPDEVMMCIYTTDRAAVDLWGRRFYASPVPGVIELGFRESGDYRIELYQGSRNSSEMLLGVEDVVLTPGANSNTLTVPGLHRLGVTLDAPPREREHCVLRSGKRSIRPDLFDDGRAEFWVCAGDYELFYSSAAGRSTWPVSVSADRELRFTVQIPHALLATHLADGGRLARAGVIEGDLIIRVAGKPLAGVDQCRDAIHRVRYGNSVEIDIERAGQILQRVILDAPDSDHALGAQLTPYPSKEVPR